ncbi:MAG: hypothetical protein CM15mP39_10950 [Synechococcus sp.]|nr:MAG: hypothetical protein CM15mP39_10950 [Synechococcus sp.]
MNPCLEIVTLFLPFSNGFLSRDIPLIFRTDQLQNLIIELSLTGGIPSFFKEINTRNGIGRIIIAAG